MTRFIMSLALASGLGLVAFIAFVHFALAGRWMLAALFGLAIPIGAAIEWRTQWQNGEEAGQGADRFIALLGLALAGIALG